MKKFVFGAVALALLFGACQSVTPTKPQSVSGSVELTFDLERKTATATYRPSGLYTQAVQTSSAVSFGTPPTMGFLADAGNAQNYVSATFSVNNLTGSSLTDLTLVAKHQQGNHIGTALKNAVNFSGDPLDLNIFARNVKPVLMPSVLTPSFTANSSIADLQLFTESEIVKLQAQAVTANEVNTTNNEYLLPYGYVARSSATSRLLPSGNGTGSLTVAVRLPNINEPSGSLRRFTMTFVAFDQPVTSRVSESLEEQGANSGVFIRATALGANQTALLSNSTSHQNNNGNQVNVCRVRTAGTAGSPAAHIGAAVSTGSGTLDPCFGNLGNRVFNNVNLSDKAIGSRVLSDGSVLVFGETAMTATNTDALVLKYTPEGALDRTFGGGDGIATISGATNDLIGGFHVLPDGKMYLVGTKFRVYKLNADGTQDATFGTNGYAETTVGAAIANDLVTNSAVFADGSIVLVGAANQSASTASDMAIAVFTDAGILNNSINGSGKLFWSPITDTTLPDYATHVYVNSDNSFVVVGSVTPSASAATNTDFGAVKFDSSGQIDITFGGGGSTTVEFLGAPDYISAAIRLTDGSIVMAGESTDPVTVGTTQFAIAKLSDSGQLDPTFNGTGILNVNIASSVNEEVRALKALSDGSILAAGTSFSSSRAQEFRMVKVGANGTLISTFGTSGVAAPVNFFAGAGNDIPSSITVLSDNSIVLGGYGVRPLTNGSETHFALVKFTPAGVVDTTFGTNGLNTNYFLFTSGAPQLFDVQVLGNNALLHGGWMNFSFPPPTGSQGNNIVLYKVLP
jgi:uncharacterized delta-60 repeat protein